MDSPIESANNNGEVSVMRKTSDEEKNNGTYYNN